ncbi:hypothetical protein ACK33D_08880 [Aeromonas hydrophila]
MHHHPGARLVAVPALDRLATALYAGLRRAQ